MRLSNLLLNNTDSLVSDGDFDIFGMLNTKQNDLKLLTYLSDKKYINELQNKSISCMICTKELMAFLPQHITGIIVAKDPTSTFWKLHENQKNNNMSTRIGENTTISKLAYISPNNVTIGDNVIIEEFVSIKAGTKIGNNVIVRSGSVIGGEGFQAQENADKSYKMVKHLGNVIIEDEVEIQQGVYVDKAIFNWDSTIIGKGTKVDNCVHIGHAVKIGKNCRITAGVIFAGSVVTEDNVWFGINSTIRNGMIIGKNASISMGSVVTKNVEIGERVTGNFAIEHSKFIKNLKNETSL